MNRKLRFMKNILAEILNYLLFFAAGKVLLTDFAGIRQGMSGLFLLGPFAGFLLYRKEELPAVWGFLFAASSAGGLVFSPLSGKSVLEDMGHFRDALLIYD